MQETREIKTVEDVKMLVDKFYDEVRRDALLAPVFEARIKNWPPHLETICRFWETLLLGNYTYRGSPFPKHARLPIEKKHFDRWLALFNQTVDENFEGEKALEAKTRAQQMGGMFLHKIEYMRATGNKLMM